MSSRRVLKAAEAIREVVSMAILTDLKDPRVKNVTVTFVEVSGDLRHAKVHVSVMDDENGKQLCLKGLQSAAGYLQKKVGNRIETRYVPRLKFELDRGIENSMVVTRILEEVLPEEKLPADEPTEATGNDGSDYDKELPSDPSAAGSDTDSTDSGKTDSGDPVPGEPTTDKS